MSWTTTGVCEVECKVTLETVRSAIREKKKTAEEAIEIARLALEVSMAFMVKRKEAVEELLKNSSGLDGSALKKENEEAEERQKREINAELTRRRSELAIIEAFERSLTAGKTEEEYKELLLVCDKLRVSSNAVNSFEEENRQFLKRIRG